MASTQFTDVLVVGAGPVGTLIGLGLAHHSLDTLIIGKLFKLLYLISTLYLPSYSVSSLV